MATVALSMIVKNEAHVIARCLRSVVPHITHWAIVDTGSTDGTQANVRRELAGIPGELIEREWVNDFAHSRNQALELAKATGAEYLLFLDADEELVCPDGAEPLSARGLTSDVHLVATYLGPTLNYRCKLVDATMPWRWSGALHERIGVGDPETPVQMARIEGVYIENHDDAVSWKDPNKTAARIKLLERCIEDEPGNAHNWHLLATELGVAKQYDRAIEAHRRYLSMGVEGEIKWLSLSAIAALRHDRGDPLEEILAACLEAFAARPTRAEPFWMMAEIFTAHGKPELAAEMYTRVCLLPLPRTDNVFPFGSHIYEWGAKPNRSCSRGRLAVARQNLQNARAARGGAGACE